MRIFLQHIVPILPQLSAILFTGTALYLYRKQNAAFLIPARWFMVAGFGWQIMWAGLLTFLQYWVWSQSDFTRLLLPPHQPLSYFLIYVGRFWLPVLTIITCALLWFYFCAIANKIKPVFGKGVSAWFAGGMLVLGWPYGLLFLFATLLFAFLRGLMLLKKSVRPELDIVMASVVTLPFIVVLFCFARPLFVWLSRIV